MKLLGIALVFLLTGCASLQPQIGNPNQLSEHKIHSNLSLYAKLEKKNGRYVLTNICDANRDIFTNYPSCQSLIKRRIGQSITNPWNSYVNLSSLQPAFDTNGHICSTVFFVSHYASKTRLGGDPVPRCKPYDYWESDIAWGEFGQWLYIFPLIAMSYYEEVYFDWDAYSEAIREAVKSMDRKSLLKTAEANYEKNRSAHYAEKARLQEEKRLAKLEKERKKKEESNRRVRLFQLLKDQKVLGGEVCSIDNRFGYLEQSVGTRIKVLMKGKVSNRSAPDYFLFKSDSTRFNVINHEEFIWDTANNWASCDLTNL